MRVPVSVALAGVLLAGAWPIAQRGGGTSPATHPHLVRIDAIVSDAQGRAVNDLKPADFELLEDGVVQSIETARFAPSPSRLFAVFIDEYHLGSGVSTARARAALARFIEQVISPDDLFVVMKPLDSLLAIRFGHDAEAAQRTIAAIEGRDGDYTPRNAYERGNWAGAPERIEASRAQVVLSALNALALEMGALGEARKTLIVVTEALGRPARRRGQEYLTTLDTAIRSANRANVSAYVLDPREAPGADAGAASREAVEALTKETGGQVIAGGDLDAGLRRIGRDASSYYLITYRSSHKEDGAFHPVQLRVKRPRVEIRARAGYWAPSPDDVLQASLVAKANEPRPPLRLEPARHVSTLIQPWFGLSRTADGRTRVTFVWEPAVRVPGERARHYPTRVDLTALAQDDTVLFEGQVLPAGPTTLDGQIGPPARAVFETGPGSVRLRMKIEDEASQPLDNDVRDLTVRDWRAPVMVGTPVVLRARNAREFRAITADPDALPVAAREFSRAERLLIRFPAYAPAGDRTTVSARLLGRAGQLMREVPVEAAPMPGGSSQVDLPLAGLAPGAYTIEVVATSPSGEGRDRIPFRVTN